MTQINHITKSLCITKSIHGSKLYLAIISHFLFVSRTIFRAHLKKNFHTSMFGSHKHSIFTFPSSTQPSIFCAKARKLLRSIALFFFLFGYSRNTSTLYRISIYSPRNTLAILSVRAESRKFSNTAVKNLRITFGSEFERDLPNLSITFVII